MRVIFFGTPEFAATSLEALLRSDVETVAVVTSPDKPAGRGREMRESAVKQYALKRGLPILQPEKLKDTAFLEQLHNFRADLFVVVAFRMLPEEVWKMPPLGTINLHASLLPEYRGAAPINWAIINGEIYTGTTVFFIEKEIDTGSIISCEKTEILPEDNAGTLHDKLMTRGAQHLVEAVRSIAAGKIVPVPQNSDSTDRKLKHAPKIFRETCRIDWNRKVKHIHNMIRGLSPYPAAWTNIITPKGERLTLKIFAASIFSDAGERMPGTIDSDNRTYLRIATQDGLLVVENLQLEGKKRMDIRDFLRGISDIETYKIEISI